MARPGFLLLIHQLPPSPAYLRVKVQRRLQQIGAFPLKQTVYALPRSDEALEDFQWLRQEIEAEGGSAIIAEAHLLEGFERGGKMVRPKMVRRKGLTSVEEGSTWVTRAGVGVDRIASAWLIQRFIDRRARFRFVSGRDYVPRDGELRFDMTGGEYTHEKNDCTFQTLSKRFQLRDKALVTIGKMVHDIDLKDEAFKKPGTTELARAVRELRRASDDDRVRLARGRALFEELYSRLRR